ncbi:MAG: septum formation initiator family protein [Candidatus Magasanikbacteria bacterium]
MNKEEQQSPVRRFFGSRAFLLLALLVMTSFAFGFARAYYQDYKFKQEIQRLEEEVKALESKKLKSLDMLEYVASSSYVEDKARTELNMKMPGEQVIFVNNAQTAQDNEKSPGDDGQIVSNPVKWFYYFIYDAGERKANANLLFQAEE